MSKGNPEIGWLIGTTNTSSEAPHANGGGVLLWPNAPDHASKGGDWRPEELRIIQHPAGRVAVMGECLATDAELESAGRRAVETGDMTAITNLPGSYASIVRDGDGATHFIGDAVSQHPLYLRQTPSGVQFSSHTEPFRRGSGAAAPDKLSLAVMVGLPWTNELKEGRTPLEGVMRTLPQGIIHVSPEGVLTTSQHNSMVPDKPLSVDEAAEQLRAGMQLGAARRVASGRRITADYSGGYDSTSAAYVMAEALGQPLTVATHHTPEVPIEDMDYVRAYLQLPQSKGKFNHHIFEEPLASAMYRDLDTVPAGDLPDISIRDRSRQLIYDQYLRSLGSEIHITGNGADALLDMPAFEYLGDYVKRLHTLPRFLSEVLFVADANKMSLQNVLQRIVQIEKLDPRSRLLAMAQILGTGGTYKQNYIDDVFGSTAMPQWLTPTARKEVAEYAAAMADKAGVPEGMDPANYRIYRMICAMGDSQHGISQDAARSGLRNSAVYFDNDVMQACLGLPAHERMNPRVFKQLLGRSLAGIVPPEVTSRKTKGEYSKQAYEGLRASADVLRGLLRNSRLGDLGIIDPKKVQDQLESGLIGGRMPWASFTSVIAAERWLRDLDDASWQGRDAYRASPAPSAPAAVSVPVEPLADDDPYGMPSGVIAAVRESGGAIVLNMPTGEYQRLNQNAVSLVQALTEGGTIAAARDLLRSRFPDIPEETMRAAVDAGIRQLTDMGILAEGGSGGALMSSNLDEGAAVPVHMIPESEDTPNVRWQDYAAAANGLALVAAVKGQPFKQQVKVLQDMRSAAAKEPATPEELCQLLAAARRIGRWSAGRTACLETSMAAVMGAAIQGKEAYLVLSARTDPESFHAWPQTVDGVTVRTAADEKIEGVFQPLLRI